MNIIAQEAKKRQAIVKLANRKGKSYASRKYGENLYKTCVYYAKRYGTLVCTYWNLTIEAWESLPRDNGRKHLPDDLFHNPEAFKELYKKAFNEEIGCRYDFIYSKGLKRI